MPGCGWPWGGGAPWPGIGPGAFAGRAFAFAVPYVAVRAIGLGLYDAVSRHDPLQLQAARNPLALFSVWKQARRECALAVKYLGARPEIDRARLGVAGYSMGSFLAVLLAAADLVQVAADAVAVVEQLLGHRPALVDGQGQRLLAVNVLLRLRRGDVDQGMPVIGCADEHGVDILVLKGLPVVAVGFHAVIRLSFFF